MSYLLLPYRPGQCITKKSLINCQNNKERMWRGKKKKTTTLERVHKSDTWLVIPWSFFPLYERYIQYVLKKKKDIQLTLRLPVFFLKHHSNTIIMFLLNLYHFSFHYSWGNMVWARKKKKSTETLRFSILQVFYPVLKGFSPQIGSEQYKEPWMCTGSMP